MRLSRLLPVAVSLWVVAPAPATSQQATRAVVIRAERWGFVATVPVLWNVAFIGPPRASCDPTDSSQRILLRPPGPARPGSPVDTVRVQFVRGTFADAARLAGFIQEEGEPFWRADGSERSDSATYWEESGGQGLEGSGITREYFPNHAEAEEPSAVVDFLLSMVRHEQAGGCALMLSLLRFGPDADRAVPFLRSVRLLHSRRRRLSEP